MLDLIHVLHIAGATVFVGSVVFFDWAVGGALARATPPERQKIYQALRPFGGAIIMGSLALTLTAGIARLVVSGMVDSFGDLLGGYGLRALSALILVIGSEALAAPLRKRVRAALDAQDDAGYLRAARQHRWLNAAVLSVVVLLMVSMRLGW